MTVAISRYWRIMSTNSYVKWFFMSSEGNSSPFMQYSSKKNCEYSASSFFFRHMVLTCACQSWATESANSTTATDWQSEQRCAGLKTLFRCSWYRYVLRGTLHKILASLYWKAISQWMKGCSSRKILRIQEFHLRVSSPPGHAVHIPRANGKLPIMT